MSKVKVWAALLGLLASACGVWAEGTLSGRVTDRQGEPLEGAQVRIEDTALGAETDAEGLFAIDPVPAGELSDTITY